MRRRLLATLLVVLTASLCFSGMALSKDSINAVKMMSYEQSWMDSHGTISLKNNTSEHLRDVTFLMEYMDMNGVPLDYELFTEKVDIDPGMTRKVDIMGYETGRHYHYYKTKNNLNQPTFKVRFELKDYNSLNEAPAEESLTEGVGVIGDKVESYQDTDKNRDIKPFGMHGGSSAIGSIIMLIVSLGLMILYVWMFVTVAKMAQRRNRSEVLWVIVSIIATPFLAMIVLSAIGNEPHNHLDF